MAFWFWKKRRTRAYGEIDNSEPKHLFSINGKLPFKKIAWAFLLLAVLGLLVGTVMVAWISRDLPDPNKLSERQVDESTKIYDRTGTHLLYEIYQDQKRTNIELDKISPWIAKATVAVEDKYFYEHNGIRILSIIRAGINNLLGRVAGSGGASTLTQQLIKNTIVGDEHSYFRKIKEAILAMQLEKKYTKPEILQMYLNAVPYGSTNYGVESASQGYFKKSTADIDLAEAATLAAIVKAPTKYLNNPDALRDRRDLVLRLMFDQGMITEDQKNEAQNSALRLYHNTGLSDAPHFILYVKQLLTEQFGEKMVDTGGLKVITTLDYDLQVTAQNIVKEQGDKYVATADANNAALVGIDPKTGQILAMVGSRDYENDDIDGQFNVAVLGKRQPGSSFKPFVYLAAFEKGYTPETVLYDVTTNFEKRTDGTDYIPKNYDGTEHGLVTLRKALQGSLNIPAVKTLYLVGQEKVINLAQRFGYATLSSDAIKRAGLSLVLGGAEVNLLEHTNGYATLADNGVYHTPVSILKVTNPTGENLVEWKPDSGSEATTPEMAALITNVLSDNQARAYMFGLNSTLVLGDRPVAAKTGTTNDNKDAWTMGYTPSIAAGVWVGNTTPSPMKGGGSLLAGTIWNQFMKAATKDTPTENFLAPPENTATKPVLRGADNGIVLKLNENNGKIATSSTPEYLIVNKTYLPPHDILYYVNKDDPNGPAPENPESDSQYQGWEDGLYAYIDKNRTSGHELSLEEPPTELDTGFASELAPTVNITTPQEGEIFNNRLMAITVAAGAPRGVSRVTFTVDGQTLGQATTPPFNFIYAPDKLKNGNHAIKVFAEDDLGNVGVAVRHFILDAPAGPPDFEWKNSSPLELSNNNFPFTVSLTPDNWDNTEIIKIYLIGPGTNKYIYNFNHTEDSLKDGDLSFTWKTVPAVGSYQLKGVLTDKSGNNTEEILNVVVK
ncbi:MAG: hypothetical protein A2538_05235 [Candidatus Magasanikbacteria bacterium RIFOXYD2_FULL_41_14]|uniref:Uncharacterized protein n=1 Tax=Candidatus Magasanikbacteria bacterium RIFOXYD2_FULL_41_14 TaxID=1798709 RepID=A0A1F6PBS1_9BACT|nr:MAG: hypothetical protein A2538_05235 [Candidatus Magasanikbacteria bacterium RIFOXYD2_FULL_41_14]